MKPGKCPKCGAPLKDCSPSMPEDGGMGYPMGPTEYCPECGWDEDDGDGSAPDEDQSDLEDYR